jgi:hypothetical protein
MTHHARNITTPAICVHMCIWVCRVCASSVLSHVIVKLKQGCSCICSCGVWFKIVNMKHARFEVLRPVVMKSSIFWDITPCIPLKVDWRFGGTSHSSLAWYLLQADSCLVYSTLKMEAMCSSETRLTFNGLHGGISQKIELFVNHAFIDRWQAIWGSKDVGYGQVGRSSYPVWEWEIFSSAFRLKLLWNWPSGHLESFPRRKHTRRR